MPAPLSYWSEPIPHDAHELARRRWRWRILQYRTAKLLLCASLVVWVVSMLPMVQTAHVTEEWTTAICLAVAVTSGKVAWRLRRRFRLAEQHAIATHRTAL